MFRRIAAWLVLTSLANVAFASDLCLPVAPLQFKGQQISRLCQSEIPRLLDQQLDFQGMMGPLYTYAVKAPLNTCNQYINLVGIGKLAPSRMESWTEYSIYMRVCGTLFATARAHKPKTSFFGKNPIDLKILPPTQLPNGATGDAQDELNASFSRGESAEDFLVALEKENPAFDRKQYLAGWEMVLLARADFDGNGIEDALVSYSASPTDPDEHYFWYGIGVLKRTSSNGPAEWIDFNNFKWAAPNLSVKRDAPPKSAASRPLP
jgi:hypothetical protein